MKRLFRSALVSLSLASLPLTIPALAHADDGYVTGNVNMRAGPAPDYPLIAQIPAGTEVDVQGCTEGWEWCDVIAYGNRGWVAGTFVEYEYQDQPVLLSNYGAQIGIPIVTFVIGSYWDSHYRSRPFYHERSRWYGRPVAHQPPPPPLRHPYRPPSRGSFGHGLSTGNPQQSISHRPMHGPVGPVPGLHSSPPNQPRSVDTRSDRGEPGNRPADQAMPQPARPARNAAEPSSRYQGHQGQATQQRANDHAPSDRSQKGKPTDRDKKDDNGNH